MQFYKYWASAQATVKGPKGPLTIDCRGYSNESIEDALTVAQQRAKQSAQRASSGNDPGAYYSVGAIREEIIDEFKDDGQTTAIISRNSYGCLVLNTPQVFFADVDLPQQQFQRVSIWGFLGALLAGKKEPDSEAPDGTELANTLKEIVRTDPSLRVRLYRTLLGFRVMIVSKLIPANTANSCSLLEQMKADKLYASLCQSQDCYRARLSPKPWRCSFQRPPVRFPYASASRQQRMEEWVKAYDQKADKFATCHFVGEFGTAPVHPVAANIANLHDHFTLSEGKPLA